MRHTRALFHCTIQEGGRGDDQVPARRDHSLTAVRLGAPVASSGRQNSRPSAPLILFGGWIRLLKGGRHSGWGPSLWVVPLAAPGHLRSVAPVWAALHKLQERLSCTKPSGSMPCDYSCASELMFAPFGL